MPELAEVEFYRKEWDAGLRKQVVRGELHAGKRILRGVDTKRLTAALKGVTYVGSEARAKLMCFRFSRGVCLGIHLGMTGKLRVEPARFTAGRHDHLVLRQKARTLVFSDPRQFGRVHFHEGRAEPAWWAKLPPAVTSPEFTLELVSAFLKRRARLAVKAALLMQTAFPGVGNWMADEILWQARIDPRRLGGRLSAKQIAALWHATREICEVALATIGKDFSDPPEDWLIHERWTNKGTCPRDGLPLKTATIGGRTTRWCPRCQR